MCARTSTGNVGNAPAGWRPLVAITAGRSRLLAMVRLDAPHAIDLDLLGMRISTRTWGGSRKTSF